MPHSCPSRSRLMLFSGVALVAVLGVMAAGLTLWNMRQIRESIRLRRVVHERFDKFSLVEFNKDFSSQRLDYVRQCYKEPEKIDLHKISWNLVSRPTPFVGYAPESGVQAEGIFNAQQLRARRDVQFPKPREVYRIFITGGSFVYGIGAPNQDLTVSAYLERLLNERRVWPGRRVEVFNAAVCGWTTTHERIWIENRLSQWQPDLVIALTGANDVHWSFAGYNTMDLRTYEDELFFELINSSLRRAGLAGFGPTPPVVGGGPVAPQQVAERFVKNVRLSAAALEIAGARYVLALQPTLSPKNKPLAEGEREWLKTEPAGKVAYLEKCFGAISQALGEPFPHSPSMMFARNPHNMAVLNLQDVFARRADPIYIDLFHMGDKGNELVAQRLADEIQRLETKK